MAIQKRFIHFKKFSDFNSKKLSANEANTQYTVGVSGAIQNGEPDVLYQSYCWIKDTKQQWTHGQLYDGTNSSVTESTINNWGFTKNTGTVNGVKINGTTKNPSSGIVDLGTVITAHQTLKTINGQSLIGSGDITISGGSSNSNVQAVDTGDVIDDVTVNYATKTYVDELVGDINSILESIINGGAGAGSVMPIVLNAINCSTGNSYTTPSNDNPNAKKLYEELMLLSNNSGEGNLDVGLVTIYLTVPGTTGTERFCDVTSYSLAPSHIAEGILLYKEGYSYYVLQQDGTIQSVFYD